MKIHVLREACCAQDDQLGPLDATYDLPSAATLRDLVDAIVASGFLQYSSSHTLLLGESGSTGIVRMPSAHYCPGMHPEFLVPADTRLQGLLDGGPLRFRFVF